MKLLSEKFIEIVDEIPSWKEAVLLSSKILLKNKYITEKYIEKIFENIETMGPYMVLAPELLMPHARPEDGALKTGISLLKVNKPIDFFGNEISIIVTLSSVDSNDHIDYIQKLVSLLDEENIYLNLLNARKKSEVIKLISV
ncbi:MAG: PTS sugar transporter subunit IIA [Fusobacteriaceae bacterium]